MRSRVLLALLLLGCATAPVKAQRPGADAQLAEAGLPGSQEDPGGDADFHAAAKRSFASDAAGARAALESFLAAHPDHRLRPAALALLARVQLAGNDLAGAQDSLSRAGNTASPDLAFVAGLLASRQGHHSRALELLRPFAAGKPPLIGGQADPEADQFLHIALAESLASTDPVASLAEWEGLCSLDGQREHERAYARQRAEQVAAKIPGEVALNALARVRTPLQRALLAPRAAATLRARGDEAGALRLEQETAGARRDLGFEPAPQGAAASGDPLRLGLAVPQSGAQSRLGEVVMRGGMLVLSDPAPSGEPAAYQLYLRDAAGSGGAGAAAAAWSLAREDAVMGVLATPDPRGLEMATREGVPVLLLDEHAPGAHTSAFQLIHAPEARATALAQRALALGARRFVVLGPETPAGKRLANAFKNAVTAGGGGVVGQLAYPQGATSFSAQVNEIRKLVFDALFVPDDATRLELIAPALAVADIWPRSPRPMSMSTRAGNGRRDILLLSTALGLSERLLRNAERYVQGAMLCPGYFPAEDARGGTFVSRFREAYGTSPTAADAYGYDGLSILRGLVERGARTRAEALRLLSSGRFEGLTGDIRFGANHGRVDLPLVYFVDGNSIRLLK